jgi:hypothetical protein
MIGTVFMDDQREGTHKTKREEERTTKRQDKEDRAQSTNGETDKRKKEHTARADAPKVHIRYNHPSFRKTQPSESA